MILFLFITNLFLISNAILNIRFFYNLIRLIIFLKKEGYSGSKILFFLKEIFRQKIKLSQNINLRYILLNSIDYTKLIQKQSKILFETLEEFFLRNANKIKISYKDISLKGNNFFIIKNKIEYTSKFIDENKNLISLQKPQKLKIKKDDNVNLKIFTDLRIIEFESTVRKLNDSVIMIDTPHRVFILVQKKIHQTNFKSQIFGNDSLIGIGILLRFSEALININVVQEYENLKIKFSFLDQDIFIESAQVKIENFEKQIAKIIFVKVDEENQKKIRAGIYKKHLL